MWRGNTRENSITSGALSLYNLKSSKLGPRSGNPHARSGSALPNGCMDARVELGQGDSASPRGSVVCGAGQGLVATILAGVLAADLLQEQQSVATRLNAWLHWRVSDRGGLGARLRLRGRRRAVSAAMPWLRASTAPRGGARGAGGRSGTGAAG